MEFAVVEFGGSTKARKVVPVAGVKDALTGEPFAPTAGEDFEDGPNQYRVKWQKSMDDDDGFFEASVLCLGGSLQSAISKANDMGIKLGDNPLLEIPSTSKQTKTELLKDSRSQRKKRNLEIEEQNIGKSNKKRKDLNGERKEVTSLQGASRGNNKGQRRPQAKDTKARAVSKPANSQRDQFKDQADLKQPRNNAVANPVVKERLEKALAAARANPVSSTSNSRPVDLQNVNIACEQEMQQKKTNFSSGMTSEKSMRQKLNFENKHSASNKREEGSGDTDAQRADTLPLAELDKIMAAQSSPPAELNLSDQESESCDGSDDDDDYEDEVAKVVDENMKLKKKMNQSLADLAVMTVRFNKAQNIVSKTKEDLKHSQDRVEKLSLELQANKDKIATLEEELRFLKSDHGDQTYSPLPKDDHIDLDSDGESKISSYSKRSTTPVTTVSTVTATPPPSKVAKKKSGSSGSKKRQGYKIEAEDFPVINIVADKVLGHLKETAVLPENQNGVIDIGFGIHVPNKGFIDNFESNSTNIGKMTRNLTTMIWSKAERISRSLDGTQSNRYKDSKPKAAATPQKINAVIGCVKAHLIKSGEKAEGTTMQVALQSCRKTIGTKFNEDCTNQKRTENSPE